MKSAQHVQNGHRLPAEYFPLVLLSNPSGQGVNLGRIAGSSFRGVDIL